jgi:F1F0 ATPase subunit 2
MDEHPMTQFLFAAPPALPIPLLVALYLIAGLAVGALYFGALWWNVRRLLGEGGALAILALTLGRLALVAAALTAASFQGAAPLLAAALGVLAARRIVVRAFGERIA